MAEWVKHISQEAVIESELDCEQSNADSGATPIRSAGRAPDENQNKEDEETHVATNLEISRKGRFVDV